MTNLTEIGEHELQLTLSDVVLTADLELPLNATGLVIFAHGSGSSRRSPRNRMVAQYLGDLGLATLLFDLLTEPEQRRDETTRALRFDIAMLSRRLIGVIDVMRDHPALTAMDVGLFGASTGAAAALIAAAERASIIKAVVSRGGRTDLAAAAIERVEAATLLLVGEHDQAVIEWNQQTAARLHAPHRLEVIPGASHLFEEPGKLLSMAERAGDWFLKYLRRHD
ncbi:MAG: dienelactone hydrolase family protein [Pseudomonadota bacterium]